MMLLILWPVLIVGAALVLPDGWFSVAAIGVSVAVIGWHVRTYRPGNHRPPEPEGVRIVHPDGSETPCELAYVGIVDGLHEWEVTTKVHVGDRVYCDVLPGRTTLSFPCSDDVAGARWGASGYRMEGRA